MATYTYSLSADFGDQICIATLTDEILAEGAIVTALSYITVSPPLSADSVDIVFVSALSGGEVTALNGVVAAHDGSICPEPDENYRTYSETASANALAKAKIYTDSHVASAAGGDIDVYNNGTIVAGSPFENQDFLDFTVTVGWYNASWLYRKKITIDYTKVAGTLTNFPVLVSLTSDSDLTAKAKADGYDILFTSADGATKLNHERVSYATGTLQAWVKVPSLSSTKNTVIYMYYGNSGASDQQNITGTWNPSHKAVYHFENSLLDSTSNDNDGSNNGSSDTASGKVGRGRDFDGNDYILYPYNGSLNITAQVTVETWVRLSNANTNQKIISNVNDSINRGFMLAVQNGNLYPEVWDSGGTDYTFSSGTVPSNQWVYLVITCAANGNLIGYINGTQVNSIPFSENNIGSNTDDMAIGACAWTPRAFYVTGQLDEVRISNTIRSQNWITTCYNNQNSPATFLSLGAEQSDQSFVSVKVPDQVFGSRFTTANSLSESGTTSSTWQSKVLLTAPDLPAGKYRIGWYAEVRETDGAAPVEARILVNYSDVKAYTVIEPQDTNNYYPFGGAAFHDVTGEVNFVRVNFQFREMGSGTAYIRNARLEIWRVS